MVSGLAGRGISKTQFPLWVSFPLFCWGVGEGDVQLDLEVKGASESRGYTARAGGGFQQLTRWYADTRKWFTMRADTETKVACEDEEMGKEDGK